MKIGEGHAEAWLRGGMDELAQALKAFPDSIGPIDEPGLVGTATPAIVTDQMGYHHEDSHLPPIEPAAAVEPPQMEIGD
ncbi:MAG TPA: hypothetical protein VHC22_01620 [Pirellulales bacterium]|nr:hypothetical protein [Pirellulales bacterium]